MRKKVKAKPKIKKYKLQDTALAITRWVGSPQSIFVHTILFTTGFLVVITGTFSFNSVLLVFNTLVSLEAIYLALFIQMTVNYTSASLEEVEEAIDEIQEDVDEIQEDIDEIQEDVEEIQEDDKEDDVREAGHKKTLEEIHIGLQKLMVDIEKLQTPPPQHNEDR